MHQAARRVVHTTICAAIFLLAAGSAAGETLDRRSTDHAARVALAQLAGDGHAITRAEAIDSENGVSLAWLYQVEPLGFLVLSGDRDLPPLIAYSLRSKAPAADTYREQWLALLRTDIENRLAAVGRLSRETITSRHQQWQQLLQGDTERSSKRALMQWPPAGSTSTGGWLESNWHQSAPYNNDCPMDPVTAVRSVAGCPAVAMAQIMNYHRTANHTVFDDSDDYYHNYAGRSYWIDDDYAAHDFPSFVELSNSLAQLESTYAAQDPVDDAGSAALTFACGVAAQQVFTSSVSGTFGVTQADQAYQRFAVDGAELLYDTAPDLYLRLADNMKQALPAHLAVVTPDWTAGHNVVVDGYNTDAYFHLNFGWGGSYNGWYLLPDEIPYSLTVVEGVIVDINPSGLLFKDGFEGGSTDYWSDVRP